MKKVMIAALPADRFGNTCCKVPYLGPATHLLITFNEDGLERDYPDARRVFAPDCFRVKPIRVGVEHSTYTPTGEEEEFLVESSGFWFSLDNFGTSFDPMLSQNPSPMVEGKRAPEGAMRFGEFRNCNNEGYSWIYPSPLGPTEYFHPFEGEDSTWASHFLLRKKQEVPA